MTVDQTCDQATDLIITCICDPTGVYFVPIVAKCFQKYLNSVLLTNCSRHVLTFCNVSIQTKRTADLDLDHDRQFIGGIFFVYIQVFFVSLN